MKKSMFLFLIAAALLTAPALGQSTGDLVSTREMDRINWMEFRDVVPSKIDTVLLPTGTLEPHGVINNGADNTAPFAISKDYRPADECDGRPDITLWHHWFNGGISGCVPDQ